MVQLAGVPLSKLKTERVKRFLFHRIGAVDTIDVFEAVTFSGIEGFISFLDPHQPRRLRLGQLNYVLHRRSVSSLGSRNFVPISRMDSWR